MKLLSAALLAGLLLGQTAPSLSLSPETREGAVIALRGAAAELGERNVVVAAPAAAGGPAPGLNKREIEPEPAGENLQRRQRPCWEDSTGVTLRVFHPYSNSFRPIQTLANGRFSYEGSCQSWGTRKEACEEVCRIENPRCHPRVRRCCSRRC